MNRVLSQGVNMSTAAFNPLSIDSNIKLTIVVEAAHPRPTTADGFLALKCSDGSKKLANTLQCLRYIECGCNYHASSEFVPALSPCPRRCSSAFESLPTCPGPVRAILHTVLLPAHLSIQMLINFSLENKKATARKHFATETRSGRCVLGLPSQ